LKNSKKHRKEQLDEENESNKFQSELSLEPSNLVDSLNCADSRSPVSISLDIDDLVSNCSFSHLIKQK